MLKDPWYRRPSDNDHGVQLAQCVKLDMVAAGWQPNVENYFGRVPKHRILEAVREAKGEQSVQLIAHLKKGDMAIEAERLLDNSGWLPEPLRVFSSNGSQEETAVKSSTLPEFLRDDDEQATDEAEDHPARLIAAE